MLRKAPAMAQLTAEELEAAYCEKKSLQQRELAAAYADSPTRASQLQLHSLQQQELEAAYPANRDWRASTVSLLGQTKARELELSLAQLCKPHFATKSLQQKELAAAYAFMAQSDGPTRARELELTIAQLCKHQFAQKSVQQTELLGKFGENINFKELLGEETEEHITNPKLAQEEMAENLTIPQLHRKRE